MRASIRRTLVATWVVAATYMATVDPSPAEARVAAPAIQRRRAEAAIQAAEAHLAAGEFGQAGDEFERANTLRPQSALYLRIYEARYLEGDLTRARAALQTYLDNTSDTPEAPERVEATTRLAALDAEIAAQNAPPAPPPEPVVEPAPEPEPVAIEPAPAPPAPPHDDTGRTVAWVVSGVGVAAVLAGTAIGFSALSTQGSLDDRCGPLLRNCPAGFEADRDRGAMLSVVADAVGIAGGVILGTGIALLFVFDGNETQAPPVQAGCDGQGCMVQARGSF